jgi:hypothetical protein
VGDTGLVETAIQVRRFLKLEIARIAPRWGAKKQMRFTQAAGLG